MFDLFLFPLKVWLALAESTISDSGTEGLTRHKKQEMMRRYPESFDEHGNFVGNKRTGKAY